MLEDYRTYANFRLLPTVIVHGLCCCVCAQVQKQCRYRFAPLVDELRDAATSEYRTTLLSFINCIVISTEKLDERVRIRNEFLGQ